MHRVAVIAVDRIHSLDLAIPIQAFSTAHSLDREDGELFGPRLYDIAVCGDPAGTTVTCVGNIDVFQLTPAHSYEEAVHADTVVVPGSPFHVPVPGTVVDVLREAHRRGARIASICTGAFILADAGLLDGRRATTHWTSADQLAENYPQVEVDPNVLFVDEGSVLTSAGAATGLDLCIHMIRTDYGSAVAADVARHVVVAPQRDGGQAQFIVHHEPGDGGSLEPTMRWLRDRLGEPVTLAEIARHAGTSTRTLNRRFREQTGTTPLQWLLRQRVHHAQELLETTSLSVEEIAGHCGFGTAVALRQHFANHVRTSPAAYRRAFQTPPVSVAGST